MHSLRHKASRLLYRIEHLLKLDIAYATKGGFWTSFSFGIGIIGSAATTIAFGNLLPRENFGTYNYLLSLGSSLMFLTLSGITPAVTRFVARGIESVVPEALRMQLRYNTLTMAIIGAVGTYYLVKENYVFGLSLMILAVAYPVGEAFHVYNQVLIGRKRFDILAKITGLFTLFGALATVLVLLITDNVLAIVATFAVMALVTKIIAYRIVTPGLDKLPPDPEAVSEMRNTAFHITGAGIVGTVASYLDKILLFQVAGPASLAVYGFAVAGPDRLKSLVKNWVSVALPRLAESSLHEIRHVFYKRIFLSVLFGAILAGVYIIFSPMLFSLFLPKYLDSVLYSRFYALSIIVAPASVYVGSIFSVQNMLRAVYLQNLGSQLIRITLFVLFVIWWQTWGLVIAAIVSQLLSACYSIGIWEVEYRRLAKKQ